MKKQKKLMLLGGSAQQVIAIDTAKYLGYYTILCDYLPDNPGQYHADQFYLISTTDKEAILKVAQEEEIDGIVAYASDPAAPTAAYVAQRMGLPGNPAESVEILCNKDRFRQFLREHGFNTPYAQGCTVEKLDIDREKFRLPVIIKPVDSSGSKGVMVIHDWEEFSAAAEFAFSFSRGGRIIVEEFVEKGHPYLIGGDVFVLEGKISLWGLLNCHRDERVNKLVPVGKSYPLLLEDDAVAAVQHTLQNLVDQLGIHCGAMNVELVVDRAGSVWPIDIGPRNGGNMIPELLGYVFGIDVVDMTIRAAMGEKIEMRNVQCAPYYATHNLHSDRSGIFSHITFSKELAPYIVRKNIYKKVGDPVEYFDNAAKALGIVFLHFPDQQTMAEILANIHSYITIHFAN